MIVLFINAPLFLWRYFSDLIPRVYPGMTQSLHQGRMMDKDLGGFLDQQFRMRNEPDWLRKYGQVVAGRHKDVLRSMSDFVFMEA